MPASNTVRFLIFSAVILLAGATVIIATRGRLGRPERTLEPRRVPWLLSIVPSSYSEVLGDVRGDPANPRILRCCCIKG